MKNQILNDYEISQRRQILRISRSSKSAQAFNAALKKRGIKMEVKGTFVKRTTYKAKNFKIDSEKGKDRVFTKLVEKHLEKKGIQKGIQKINPNQEFERLKAIREKNLEKQKNVNQNKKIKF